MGRDTRHYYRARRDPALESRGELPTFWHWFSVGWSLRYASEAWVSSWYDKQAAHTWSVVAVDNYDAPGPYWHPSDGAVKRWGYASGSSFAELRFVAPMSPAATDAPRFFRAYYISRFEDADDPDGHAAYRFIGGSLWFVIPQADGPNTDLAMRDSKAERHYADGSFERVHAITINTLPPPAYGSDATRSPGPFGSYRCWSGQTIAEEEPFFMPGVN